MTHSLEFEQLPPALFPLAKQFYKHAKYHHQIGRNDEVYVLRDALANRDIIASLRLVQLDKHLILRSMVVAPDRRRERIGLYLLEKLAIALHDRECWCFPFTELESFYASIGFSSQRADNCPQIIKQKHQQYALQGRKLLIMSRSGA